MGIKEIWENIPEKQKGEIMARIQSDGYGYTTAWFWCNGKRRPKPYVQKRVCEHINTVTGESYTIENLWPEESV